MADNPSTDANYDVAEPLLRPTLFVGLGTTGAKILKYLQELIYEEYLTPDLPVVRLLSIITSRFDSGYMVDPNDTNVLHVSVPSTAIIKQALTRATSARDKALKEWLTDRVFDVPNYNNGSANTRAAGRLHLWRNLNPILGRIANAAAACRNQAAINATNRILHRMRTTRDEDPPTSYVDAHDRPNVFVVGTLCGGTCSGMAADLGCAIQSRGISDNVMGVFTILSDSQAQQSEFAVYAANCYAALSELDWLYHPSRKPELLPWLPTGERVSGTMVPFQRVFLLSPTTMYGQAMMDAADQKVDDEPLLQMVALSLFLDACAGAHHAKASVRVDYDTLVQTSTLDPQGRRPRALSSFGAAAITFPKYRLARAAASQVAQRVIERWLSTTIDEALLTDRARATVDGLMRNVLPLLEQRAGYGSMQEDIHTTCSDTSVLRLGARELRHHLNDFPKRPTQQATVQVVPMRDRFLDDGEYRVRVSTQYNTVVTDAARALIREHYWNLRASSQCSLPAAARYLDELRKLLEGRKDVLGKRAVEISLAKLDSAFKKLMALEGDTWLKLLFVRETALRERKLDIMQRYEREVGEALKALLSVYQAKTLDVSLETVKTLRDQLTTLMSMLRECHDPAQPKDTVTCFKRIDDELDRWLTQPPGNTRYVFPQGKKLGEAIASYQTTRPEEAEALFREAIVGTTTWDRESAERFDVALAALSPATLAVRMMDPLVRRILASMGTLDVAAEVYSQWSASYGTLAMYAYPYSEMDDTYMTGGDQQRKVPAGGSWSFVFAGGSKLEAAEQIGARLPTLQNSTWRVEHVRQLDHQVILYTEEPGFSTSYMRAFPRFKEAHANLSAQTRNDRGPTTFWTDRQWDARGGPPTDEVERCDALEFLLEFARDVFLEEATRSAVATSGTSLFVYRDPENARLPYFEYWPGDASLPVQVNVGDRDSYEQAARSTKADLIITALRTKVVEVAQALGEDTFRVGAQSAANHRERQRMEKRDRGEWTDDDDTAYRKWSRGLRAFVAYVRQRAWHADLTLDENVLLGEYPWLPV